jgi:hypothetical protein
MGWPFSRGAITPTSIIQSVKFIEYPRARTEGLSIPIWKIGEELRLKSSAIGRDIDSLRELAVKHADMGKTVSGYLRRGLRLVENAASGIFLWFRGGWFPNEFPHYKPLATQAH